MATLQEELKRLRKDKKYKGLFKKGDITVSDPNTPPPRPGLAISGTSGHRRRPEQIASLKRREFKRGISDAGGKRSYLDQIAEKYLGEDSNRGMSWQEKTGMQIYDRDKQRRFDLRSALKKADESKYVKGIMARVTQAEAIGGQITEERKAKLGLMGDIIGAEATGARTDVAASSDLVTQEYRKAQLGISSAGQKSLEQSRLDTAQYRKGVLELGEATKPSSDENQLATLTRQMQKDLSDVAQSAKEAPAEETYWGLGGPNKAQEQIDAIRKSYAPELNRIKGNMIFKDFKKNFEKKTGKKITRTQWNAYIKTDKGKKYLKEQGLDTGE